jgi:hypothetical protein
VNPEHVKIIRKCLKRMSLDHLEITPGENEREYCFGNIMISGYDRPRTGGEHFRVTAVDEEGVLIYSYWCQGITDAAIAGVVQLIIQDLESSIAEV